MTQATIMAQKNVMPLDWAKRWAHYASRNAVPCYDRTGQIMWLAWLAKVNDSPDKITLDSMKHLAEIAQAPNNVDIMYGTMYKYFEALPAPDWDDPDVAKEFAQYFFAMLEKAGALLPEEKAKLNWCLEVITGNAEPQELGL